MIENLQKSENYNKKYEVRIGNMRRFRENLKDYDEKVRKKLYFFDLEIKVLWKE